MKPLNEKSQAVLNAITTGTSVDTISETTSLPVASVRAYLLNLTKAGLITYKDGVASLVVVKETAPVAEPEYTAAVNTRGRKSDPESTRQKAFAVIKAMLTGENGPAKRADILKVLETEFNITGKTRGTYVQRVRVQLGMVKHEADEAAEVAEVAGTEEAAVVA